ncbi:MAG: SDR family oxidoreductase [Ectothiorhodospiraceae bacterium AqS1]|nr:SDR family oxidoreductase [Ectothiorhodospiraceae bacterium AqS1]
MSRIDPVKPASAAVDLRGNICLVTGAKGGIGAETARLFRAAGARVLATDRDPESSLDSSLDSSLESSAGKADIEYRAFDLGSDEAMGELHEWIAKESPDILFNNAAIFDMGSILEASLEQYDRLFAVNVRAMYAVMQSCARQMVADGKRGSIINLASQAGHRGEALVAHYCATKAAVISYTQSAALALAPYGIRVNAISPGVIDTPMWETVDRLFARFENKAPGQKKREVGAAVPLGFMGSPTDVAKVALFLAGDQSSYMTAQTVGVDGGNVLR